MDEPLRRDVRRMVFAGVGGAAAGVLWWLLPTEFRGSVRPWLVILLVWTGCMLACFVWIVEARRRAMIMIRPDEDSLIDIPIAGGDRYRLELGALEQRIGGAVTDPARFALVLRPLLTDLAAERLRSRRGIDPSSDRDAARHVLGDDLWQATMSDTKPTQLTRRLLAEWIARLEAI